MRDPKYIFPILFMATIVAACYALLPGSAAEAQDTAPPVVETDASPSASREMIDFALNLRSASRYTVLAGRGLTERRSSQVRGAKAVAGRSARAGRSAEELANSIDALKQLPCTSLKGGNLSGRTFSPGVYCLNLAELNGNLVLDGHGKAAGTFIFLVEGTLNVMSGSSIRPENGAQSGNVFFVTADAEIGENAAFRANLLAAGDVLIGAGAMVSDKVLGLGNVELNDSVVFGGNTGSMKICVEQPLPVSVENSLSTRIFHFVVTGAVDIGTASNPVRVRVGNCSNPFDVVAGPQTVSQLNSGTLSDSSGSFTGNFELTDVASLTPSVPSTLGLVNLATRAANVNIVAGGAADALSLRFTNRRAITGFVEICKRAASGPGRMNPRDANPLLGGDPDVTGFFMYTIEGMYGVNELNPAVKTLQVFTIPARQCTGPIAITKGDPITFGPSPAFATVKISELPRPGSYLESVEIIPADRRNGPDILGSIATVSNTGTESVIAAPGGGHVNVLVPESSSEVDETLVTFANRSNPSRVKVCKVAGPGIPVNTLFRFTVSGWGQTDASHPQDAAYGPITRQVDIRAGDPAQGGTCEFVPGVGSPAPAYSLHQTFVNGTSVTIVENGISPDNTIPQNPGQLRTASIRVFNSFFTSTAFSGFSPNPDLTPAAGRVSRATVTARAGITEVEFSGFRFNPTVLKICKIGLGAVLGQDFNFTIALVSPTIGGPNPGTMFPPFSQNVTVTAGPENGQGGNCTFVNGSSLLGGAFNQGSTVTVTEVAGFPIAIGSMSAGPGGLAVDLPNRKGTLSGPNGLVAGINSVIFTNALCNVVSRRENGGSSLRPNCSPPNVARFDFDGDRKSDPAVYSPSTNQWSLLQSTQNGSVRTRGFGVAADIPVAADYDGDAATDIAVWRPSNGRWYFQGSTGVFEYHQWGEPGDIPQPGDYDGDGRADFGIFRPSNATWYIKTRPGQLRIVQFGIPTDKPYAADYDGDGRTDIAVFRNGTWYTQQSSTGFRIHQFGQAADVPVPADYDGDGAADFAVFRAGTWYLLSATTYTVKQLGTAADVPVPGDYDGDGKTDIAVWTPSTGAWYVRRSAFGDGGPFPPIPIILGGPGDIPAQTPISYFLP